MFFFKPKNNILKKRTSPTCTPEHSAKGDIFAKDDRGGVLGERNIQRVCYRLKQRHLHRLAYVVVQRLN